MSNEQAKGTNYTIYRDFCNGMKNQSREQVRLAGDIARKITRGSGQTKSSDTLSGVTLNFCQIETHLDNIENNLNKVSALTRQTR